MGLGRKEFHLLAQSTTRHLAVKRLTACGRELILTLAAGLLAGSLLALVNSSHALQAQASTAAGRPHPQIQSIQLRLDPGDPAVVGQLRITLVEGDRLAIDELRVRLNEQPGREIRCFADGELWACPLEDVPLDRLEAVEVTAP